MKSTAATFIAVFLFTYTNFAQLTANFSVDKSSGCSPLAIAFTNTSTGNSSKAVYDWNFGNGNTSVLKNPGAIFFDAQSYSVTLTVTDSNKTSSKTQTIIVYKNPVITDINFSTLKGCFPLPVYLTGNASAGDGTISNYLWDFGDGFTQTESDKTVVHTYTAKQNPIVNLSVTNSYGCQATIVNQNLQVLGELKAVFTPEKPVLCTISEAAKFINTSAGPGTLTYKWNFGDGTDANVAQPAHVFNKKGIYPVSLIVTSSDGCIDTSKQLTNINVANFSSAFEVEGPVCNENGIRFINKSIPAPVKSEWFFENAFYSSLQANGAEDVFNSYRLAGTNKVLLINDFGGCKDSISKQVIVNQVPELKGFVVDITSVCGPPVIVNFKDTTTSAVKWEWYSDYPNYFTSDLQAPSFNYTREGYDNMYLTVTTAAGCKNNTSKQITILKPYAKITSPEIAPNGEILSCGPRPIHFLVETNEKITYYWWEFGDTTFSQDATPVHTFKHPGHYKVSLTYTTDKGCKNKIEFDSYVVRRDMVKADFTVSNTNVCGNTPLTITNLSGNTVYYHWDLGDGIGYFQANTGQYGSFSINYQTEGLKTLKLIATDWVCADTMVKTDYIKVSPPFPKIAGYTNTCEGTRGEITLTQTTKQAITSSWDFGDGTTLTVGADQSQVKHTYAKTGWYKVMLTTTNGACTVKDSIYTTVLLKQHPVLTADKKEVCTRGDFLTITYSNFDKNPWSDQYNYGYSVYPWEHRDGSYAPMHVSNTNNNTDTTFSYILSDFEIGKEGLRTYLRAGPLSCVDTTNYIPLKITGPKPGFKQIIPDPCKGGLTVYLEDTTKVVDNVAIKSWEWNFGDGTSATYTKPGIVTHQYTYPGRDYPVYLTVTDVNGCSSQMQGWANAEEKSIKASFNSSATTISPGSSIDFSNTSTSSHADNTSYKWSYGDGTISTSFDASKTYTKPGNYKVTLIAKNNSTGCSDTSSISVTVKFINAAFTIDQSYTSASNCPPVMVAFKNTSSNASKITWNFGDGTIVNDVFNPSHIYTKAGFYKIIVDTYSDNGTKYTTVDSVVIKSPSATLLADTLHGCTSQAVTLTAAAKNGVSYTWDFGDGFVAQSVDSTMVHRYSSAGVYQPKLIFKDDNGCSASVMLANKIIIDSLFVSVDNLPKKICSPKELFFNPNVVSIAAGQAQQTLIYHWNFGTNKPADTASTKTPSFVYAIPGNYSISLQVRSPFGCLKEVKKSIEVFEGLGGIINGPLEICQGKTALFTGATQIAGNPQWQWVYHDGTKVQQQNPPAKSYADSGTYAVKLLIDNNGCIDTITHMLQVHAKPAISLSSKQVILCEGKPQTITASGGNSYTWSPATGLNTTTGASVIASPVTDTRYLVEAKSDYGCTNTDFVDTKIVHPFTMLVSSDTFVCIGKTISLRAAGASNYQWINNTSTLSSTQVANPVASPIQTTIYTVTGSDNDGCFADTATITVSVKGSPAVNAGTDQVLITGVPYQLQPVASNDVINWHWSPADYLTCSNCATPTSTPLSPVTYTVTVGNAFGCTAQDTIAISLLCTGSKVYIPSGFTPNNDGLNDRFAIKGFGINKVRYLRIYDRWGVLMFERSNFMIDDLSSAWDGNFKGMPLPSGGYVYMTELQCDKEIFTQKGTITLIR
ncbi:MAG: PKD domain-containing protein [Bacteroidota bacterium]